MFTGIIEATGRVQAKAGETIAALTIGSPFKSVRIGESIAVNGCCLTVVRKRTKKSGTDFTVELSGETLDRTAFKTVRAGDRVNLERAVKAGDALGGHFVQGHVDGTGRLLRVQPQGEAKLMTFAYPPDLQPYMVVKGSVAVDGVSLTIVDDFPGSFSVAVIPHTEKRTTLGAKKIGDPVHIEADILAKIVAKQTRLVLAGREIYEKRKMENE